MMVTVSSDLYLQPALRAKFMTNPYLKARPDDKNPLSVPVHPLYFLISPASI